MHNIRTFIGAMLVAVFLCVVIQMVSCMKKEIKNKINLIEDYCKTVEDKANAAKTFTLQLDPYDDMIPMGALKYEQRAKYVLNCPQNRVTSCTLVDKNTSPGNDKVALDTKGNKIIVTRPTDTASPAESTVFVRKGYGAARGHADYYVCSFECNFKYHITLSCKRPEDIASEDKLEP